MILLHTTHKELVVSWNYSSLLWCILYPLNKHPCFDKCPLADKQLPQGKNNKQAPLLNKCPFPFPILIYQQEDNLISTLHLIKCPPPNKHSS